MNKREKKRGRLGEIMNEIKIRTKADRRICKQIKLETEG